MAVVNVKASAVTSADGTPQVLTTTKVAGGRLKELRGTVELANGDSIASTYRIGRVHSSWLPSQLIKLSDAITSGAADFGLADTAANGGAAVSAAFFASAVSIASADVVGTDITHEAAGATVYGEIANIEKRIWEALALTADPNKYYDLTATLTAATTAAGTLSVIFRYMDGN